MQSNQVEIDEALAASLLYDDPESTICDTVTLRQIQQQQGKSFFFQKKKGKSFLRFVLMLFDVLLLI